jgi:hypothetical protein
MEHESQDKTDDLIFYISSNADFELQLSLFLSIDRLYRAFGGSGIHFTFGKTLELITESSEFDQLKGTPFETKEHKLVPAVTTVYVKRDKVYDALKKLTKKDKLDILLGEIEKKYPASLWNNDLPRMELMTYLINQQRECFS